MRASIGTGLVLMAVGAVIAFAVQFPREVEQYVDTFDLGLILLWAGILVLVMQVVMHRPRRARPPRRTRDYADYDTDEHDVHRPGYAGETRRLPTVRGDGRR
jgi:uncharacterized protein DUF6458